MSSTNRGAVRKAADYYVTPQWAIREFLDAASREKELAGMFRGANENPQIIDPCAGGDAKHAMAYPKAILECGHFPIGRHVVTVDIRNDSLAEVKADFLTWQEPAFGREYDLAITNPPFFIAQQVIEKSLRHVRDGGFVVMLLRLNFFGSQERREWWQARMPLFTFVHSQRMQFLQGINPKTGKRYTQDSIEYCHMVWKVGERFSETRLRVI